MIDYDGTPDSVWAYWRELDTWTWSDDAAITWPDDMDAWTCGEWIARAQSTLNLVAMSNNIRKLLARRLSAAAHYCTKNDPVYAWGFLDGDLELVQWLAGPYPGDTPTNGGHQIE